MSRPIRRRHILKVVVNAITPLHLGSSVEGYDTDMELVRDGTGRLVLPGTSLAGALRAALNSTSPEPEDQQKLWGSARSEAGAASWITVDDAPQLGEPGTAIRDGVSIDRYHGAAKDRLLYSREIILPGAQFDLTVSIEDPAEDADSPATLLLDKVQKLLTTTGLDIGGATRRGMGRIRVSPPPDGLPDRNIRIVEDRGTAAGMLEVLQGQAPRTAVALSAADTPDPGTIRIDVAWEPVGAVMSGQAVAALAADTLPSVTVDAQGHLRLLLAGTGIAGAIGAQIERIARTLAAAGDNPHAELPRIELPGASDLLGLPGANRTGDPAGAAAALAVADCMGSARIDKTTWESTVLGEFPGIDPQLGHDLDTAAAELVRFRAALSGAGAAMTVTPHVAIDRWTGGAADGLLYTVAEPARATSWEPIRLTVDVRLLERRGRGDLGWAVLLLALRDLSAGKIALGALVTRGLGSIRVNTRHITFAAGDGLAPESTAAMLGQAGDLDKALASGPLTERFQAAIQEAYPNPGQEVTAA